MDRPCTALLAVLVCLLGLSLGNLIVVLVPPNGGPSQQQLLLAIDSAFAASSSPLEVFHLPISTDSTDVYSVVQSYWAANASITSTVVVLGDSGPELVASGLFDAYNVPLLRISPSPIAASATNFVTPKTYFQAVVDVFASLQWKSAILVHSADYGSIALSLQEQATAANITIAKVFEVPPDAEERVLNQLDTLSTRVVVFLGQAPEITEFISKIRDIQTQVVWLDVAAQVPTFASVDLSAVFNPLTASVIRGFFTIVPPLNTTRATGLLQQLMQTAPALFTNATDVTGPSAAYDLTLLWATAVETVIGASGNGSDWDEVKSTFYGLSSVSPSLIAPKHVFHHETGDRVGELEIYNWRADYSQMVTTWTKVGQWTGAVTSAGSSSLTLATTELVFFDGTHNIPPAVSTATLTLGMLWPVFFPIQYSETARMAVDHINANGTIIPGYKLRAIQEGGDFSASDAIQSAIQLLSRNTIVILGPAFSSAAQAVQYYVGALGVPCISQSATSDSLSDKAIYPTFFRTIVADRFQGVAMAGLVSHYNWTRVCFLHYRDEYASNIADVFVSTAAESKIDVTRTSFATDATNFTDNLQVITQSKCTVIVVVANAVQLANIIPQAMNVSLFAVPGITWILSEEAGELFQTPESSGRISNDTLIFEGVFVTTPLDHPPGSPLYDRLDAELKNRTGGKTGFLTYTPFLYDSTWMAAHALGKIVKSGKNPAAEPELLLQLLRQTDFEGVSGQVKLDANGDRMGGIYGLFNYQNRTQGLVLVGQNVNGETVMLSDPIFSDHTTNVPIDPTTPTRTVSYETGAALIAIVSAVLILIVASMFPIFVNWANPLIRRSSPFFLIIILLGLVFELVSVFFWLGTPVPAFCHLRVWLGFLGVAIAYGSLLIKNARLYYLFNEPSLRVIAINNTQLLTYLILVLSPLLILLVLWSALAPFEVTLQLTQSGAENFMICTSANDKIFAGIAFGYIGVAYVIGAVLSFKTRHLPDTFKESWYIALATYNLLVITTICLVVGYILYYDAVASSVIVCVGLILGGLTTWALLFIPKFYALVYRKQEINDMSKTKNRTPTQTLPSNSVQPSLVHSSEKKGSTRGAVIVDSKDSKSSPHESEMKPVKAKKKPEAQSESKEESAEDSKASSDSSSSS